MTRLFSEPTADSDKKETKIRDRTPSRDKKKKEQEKDEDEQVGLIFLRLLMCLYALD